jgi:Domain of unknown function (DUF4404)
MNQHPLRPALDQLQSELAQVNTADPAEDLLLDLQRDTQALLEQIDQSHELAPHPDFRQRLGAAILRFEVSHPALTAALEQVADVFNRVGI